MSGLWISPKSRAGGAFDWAAFAAQQGAAMRRKYLRLKKRVLLKMIYALAAILRVLKR